MLFIDAENATTQFVLQYICHLSLHLSAAMHLDGQYQRAVRTHSIIDSYLSIVRWS